MSMTATYSAEDNKLRLYSVSRLSEETYQRVKAAGFRWAPKQELFVAPSWTPHREDLLLELCDEIEDEDYSAEERSADRAERFAGYRDKRRAEAVDRADSFDAGPAAFGHQNRERAERQAARHDRHRTAAVSQWSKAEYWQDRTKAVIGHALFKASAKVRRGRILKIEAEQRQNRKHIDKVVQRWDRWKAIAAEPNVEKATSLATYVANYGGSYVDYQHPRQPERKSSLWSLLTQDNDPISGHEAAAMYLAASHPDGPGRVGSLNDRWRDHYANRLAYERAMLANEGGTAADAEMVAGGWIGSNQIHGVNKSPATGRVVSVKVMAPKRWWRDQGPAPLTLQSINVERLPEGAYRAPTDEELAAFNAAKKASKKQAVSTINPTDADAVRLQAQLNGASQKASDVERMTQAQFSEGLKHDYVRIEERTIGGATFKIRLKRRYWASADSVLILTDKPQKPLPVDWEAVDVEPAPLTKAQG